MTMPTRRRVLGSALGAVAALRLTLPASARGTPELRSLQIVVPAPPGSQPDLLARWLAEPLARRSGLDVAVSNRPGASGALAADAVLQAPPESGPLLLAGLDHVAYSHLHNARRALDPFVDFTPVGAANSDAWVLVAGAAHPFGDVAGLLEHARAAGPLSYATTGEGSTSHLVAARLCRALGIEALAVPYKDAYLPDLIAGRVHFAAAPIPAVLPQIGGGRLRGLAALSTQRLESLPAVPSIGELGWPDQSFTGGLFLFAPAALAPRAADLNGWLVEAQSTPAIRQRYRDAGIEPTPLTLAETADAVRRRLQSIDAMRLAVFGRAR